MTTQNAENLAIVREACIAANPEIVGKLLGLGYLKGEERNIRPIRLADILLAMQSHLAKLHPRDRDEIAKIMCLLMEGSLWQGMKVNYDLRHDDLTQQSPETLAFLAEILKKQIN